MKLFVLRVAFFALLACTSSGIAADTKPAKSEIAPEAADILKHTAEFYAGLSSARADVHVQLVMALPGEAAREQEIKASVAMRRPDRFALKITAAPDGPASLICDGKTVWAHLQSLNQFIVDDAPKTIETLLRDDPHLPMLIGQMGPITDLFRDRPSHVMLNDVTLLRLVGTEKVGDTSCARVHGEQEDMDWDAWFDNGAKPALRKFRFSPLKGMVATAPEEMKQRLKGARIEATVHYNEWQFDPQLPDATFAFEPPKGAMKVAQFAPIEEIPAAAPAPEKADSLKGKPAPEFALDLLGGGKVQLADHKGKGIVILDFWATWCGPCVRALPIIEEVAIAYREKGVTVYAVNLKEEAADARKFIESKKLTLPIAMDVKGDVAKLYQVTGIPQTVVIDKQGNVAAVHVGFSPNLKETLAREIDALLAK